MKRRSFIKKASLTALAPGALAGGAAVTASEAKAQAAAAPAADAVTSTGGKVPAFAKDMLTSDMQGLGPDGKATGQKDTFTGASKADATVESAAISAGKLVMNNPVMTGQIKEGRGYSVRAIRAVQDLTARSVIRLEDIVADFPFDDSEMAELNAISGIYNREEQFLSLDQPFTVTTADGMKAQLNSAHIDIETGILTSDQEVIIDTGKARLVAQSMSMEDRGAIITFDKGVQMTINPGAVKSASETQGSDS